ncbi:MAG: hypothetical protein WC661_14970 [Opitutaceae bacterium]|jgi:Tfp pilus assembly PilM family ATPase
MFLSAKTKKIFIDFGDHVVLVAKVSSETVPFVVEDVRECPPGDEVALGEALKELQTQKSPGGLTHASCSVYTSKRVIRKLPLETKRLKEPTYLNELVAQQLRIESEKFTLAILNAADGTEYDLIKAAQKDAVFCGLPSADINSFQERLLAGGVYPERLELGTMATLGALVDYLTFAQVKTPVLMLEIDADATHSFIVTSAGLEASRPISQGLEAMIPVVQTELGLKDAESARKLFLSNAFDFTGMGPALIKKLVRELQSFIGFYEVQTGQSIGQIVCTVLPSKLGWIEETIASQLSVSVLKTDIPAWLQTRQITLADSLSGPAQDARRLGLFGLMAQYGNHAPTS